MPNGPFGVIVLWSCLVSIIDSGIFSVMTSKMHYLAQKQAVQAENVANADTPDYKAKEMVPFTFENVMKETQNGMAVTDPRHIIPASMAGVNAKTKKANSFETLPSGNSVDLEQQMMEVANTTMDYQATSAIFQKFKSLLKSALGSK